MLYDIEENDWQFAVCDHIPDSVSRIAFPVRCTRDEDDARRRDYT